MNTPTVAITNRGKLGAVLASLALFAAMLLVSGDKASAQPFAQIGVVTDGGSECVMLAADGSYVLGVLTTDFRVVSARPNQGQSGDKDHLACNATIPNPTGKAINFISDQDGRVRCGIGVSRGTEFQATDFYHQTISASGKARLTCHD